MDFHVLINPFTVNAGYWQMCIEYIFARGVSSPHHDEVTTDPMLLSMGNNIFPLISHIILQKVLTVLSPV